MKTVRRFVLLHRRWLAAILVAIAVFTAVTAVRADPPGVEVPVASHDLTAGQTLNSSDIRIERISRRPDGARDSAAELTGKKVAAPMSRGEVLTDRRLLGPQLLNGYAKNSVLVRVAVDQASAETVHVGDEVSVLGGKNGTEYVANQVRVAISGEKNSHENGTFSESLIGLVVPRKDAPKLTRETNSDLSLVLEDGHEPKSK